MVATADLRTVSSPRNSGAAQHPEPSFRRRSSQACRLPAERGDWPLAHSQREQIALPGALGYSGLQIARHYVELVLVIAVTGALPGIAPGRLDGTRAGRDLPGLLPFPLSFDWSLAPSLLLWSLLFALLAALTGAAALCCVAAIACHRPKPCAGGTAALLALAGRIDGLRRLLDPPSRMVLPRWNADHYERCCRCWESVCPPASW